MYFSIYDNKYRIILLFVIPPEDAFFLSHELYNLLSGLEYNSRLKEIIFIASGVFSFPERRF